MFRTKQMSDVANIVDHARNAAAYLVERERKTTGSKMVAYERVGSMIGASSGWVRKFVGRNEDVRPTLVVGLNILELYRTVCARVEQDTNNMRSRAAALRAGTDEASKSALELADRASRSPPGGAGEG